MKTGAAVIVLVLAAIGIGPRQARTAPKPSEIPLAWELGIKVAQPRSISIHIPQQGRSRVFWYLRYTVTNTTAEDQMYVPEFILYTDTGQALRAGRGIPSSVFRQIKSRHNDPLMRKMTEMTGTLRQGRDNAKSGVAIWPDFDPTARQFDVFVGSLSGETVRVKPPKPVTVTETDAGGREKKVTKNEVILAKTLRLHYELVGNAARRQETTLSALARSWVMR